MSIHIKVLQEQENVQVLFIYSYIYGKDGKDELINNISRQQHKSKLSRFVRQITNCKTGLVSFLG